MLCLELFLLSIALFNDDNYKFVSLIKSTAYLSAIPDALTKYVKISIGNGKTIVEFFSADIVLSVCVERNKTLELKFWDLTSKKWQRWDA